jgi:hypothetical protein
MSLEVGAAAGAIAKEVSNLDKILNNLFSLDFLLKDARTRRDLRTIVDRLEYVYFSREGSRTLLGKLADHQDVPRDEILDTLDQFYAEQDTAYDAIEQIGQLVKKHEIRFDEDLETLLNLIVRVKTQVRDILWTMFNDIQDRKFSAAAMHDAASVSAVLLEAIRPLNASIRVARTKMNILDGKA